MHALVQFQNPLTLQTLQVLADRGAKTVSFIPDNAVLVMMNTSVSLAGLAVNYVAPLSPYQKVSPLISGGDGSIVRGTYLVEFHPDLNPSDARQLILNLSFELLENPDLANRHLLVRIPDLAREGESLAKLAAQDAVAYIFPASTQLVQRQQVASDAPLAPGLLLASGEVVGQLVSSFGDGWDGPGRNAVTLNYFFSRMTSQLPELVTRSEIARALEEWAKVAQITWVLDASATADRTVNILFAQGDHGDGFPFDGPGGVLAHTFYPSLPTAEPIAGDMHFDDAESWHFGSNFDVFSVALHEIGHALGLGSSDNPDSVMYPYYRLRTGLAPEDREAIRTLYAARTETPQGPLTLTVNAPPATTTSTTVSLSGTIAGASGAVTVTWTSNTGPSGTASVSGANWIASNIPLAAGLNSITVTAADSTGSVSHTVSVTRKIVTPPTLSLTVNAPPATTTSATISLSGTVTGDDGPPAVTWSSSAGASGLAVLNGPNWVAFNIPLAAGFNTITITAVGETGSLSRTVSITRTVSPPPAGTDTTAPTLTITYPSTASFSTTLASLTFKGTASDPSGVASVTWSTNTGGAGTASGTNAWTAAIPLLVGFNQVVVRATDTAGNVRWRSVVVTRR